MSEQLSIFNVAGDKSLVSPATLGDTNKSIAHGGETPPCLDFKEQAIQRYLDRAKGVSCSVEKYHPNGRKAEYYRLKHRVGKQTKTIHIKGGNVNAKLANYRAKKLQSMIDRGAELREVLEQLADFNGEKSKVNPKKPVILTLPTDKQ